LLSEQQGVSTAVLFFTDRPSSPKEKGDARLPGIAKRLQQVITDTQRPFSRKGLRLKNRTVHDLAELLTEFAEDLHNQTGIWAAYENHNMRCFGTPLPITLERNQTLTSPPGIDAERVHHFLWSLYPELLTGTPLDPGDQDLNRISRVVTDSLDRAFRKAPRSSGIKTFLGQPNDYGWDVKRKLVWLGSSSYLFRTTFRNHLETHGAADEDDNIDITDDFICQKCTLWSGLGAIDVLAAVMDISESERGDLLGWNERHTAPYTVLSANSRVMSVLNVVSGKKYTVRIDMEHNPFEVDGLVVGSLVPWREEWYWSGRQAYYSDLGDEAVRDMKDIFLRECPQFVYRYCEKHAREAVSQCRKHYERYMGLYGDRLVVFQDGLSFAAALDKWARQPFRELSQQEQEIIRDKHSLPERGPQVRIPDHLVRSEHEIGVFCSPEEHMEIMDYFDTLVRGLKNPARPLCEDETDVIRGFVQSPQISPAFVRHVTELYGVDSVKAAFLLDTCDDACCMDYLLRRYKGEYFKKRYPPVTVV
jgi:hypothetical protein